MLCAVVAITIVALPLGSFAQFSGPPTAEQIQQLMEQLGAPAGTLPDGAAGMGMGNTGNSFGPPAGVEEMEKKGLEMQKQGLSRLQRGAKSMQKAVVQMEKAVNGAAKAGYPASAEVVASLAKGKAALAIISGATDFTDDVTTAIDDFNDFVDVLDANIETLNMLANFPKITKQADREMANLTKAFEKVKIKMEKAEFDLTEIFARIQANVDSIKSAYDQSIAAAKAGNPQEAFRLLEEDFFPNIGDTRQSIGMLDAVKNISRAVKSVDTGIKTAEKIIVKLDKKGIDTTKLKEIVASSKTELENLKAKLKSVDFDSTDAVDYLDNLNALREQFEEVMDSAIGDENVGNIKPLNFFGGSMPAMPKLPKGNGMGNIERLDF